MAPVGNDHGDWVQNPQLIGVRNRARGALLGTFVGDAGHAVRGRPLTKLGAADRADAIIRARDAGLGRDETR